MINRIAVQMGQEEAPEVNGALLTQEVTQRKEQAIQMIIKGRAERKPED